MVRVAGDACQVQCRGWGEHLVIAVSLLRGRLLACGGPSDLALDEILEEGDLVAAALWTLRLALRVLGLLVPHDETQLFGLDLEAHTHLDELLPLTPEQLQLRLALRQLLVLEVQVAFKLLNLLTQLTVLALQDVHVLAEKLPKVTNIN